jgi:hypothetical protein
MAPSFYILHYILPMRIDLTQRPSKQIFGLNERACLAIYTVSAASAKT